MTTRQAVHMRSLRILTAALAAGLALTGCGADPGGGSETGAGTETGAGSETGAGTQGPTDAPEAVTEIQIDRSYWFAGFKVTIGTARVVPSSFGGRAVTIEGVFQNLSTEHAEAPTESALLTVGNRTYAELDHPLLDLPEVPPQRSQPGTYAFGVDEHFVLPEAVFVVGSPSTRQATVPFTGPDGHIPLEPQPVAVTGKVLRDRSGKVFMSVSAVEVRADEPYLHQQAPSGREFLRLEFSATNNTSAGFAWVFDRDLHLKLPDGTTIGTDNNCSRAQIYPPPHASVDGGLACFLVPAPAAGEYRLTWDRYEKGALSVPVH